MGEFEQGRPLMELIKEKDPQQKIVLTFFSPSGYQQRKDYQGVDYVYYLPLDTKQNAARFLAILQPKCAIFVKYEFWYHYLATLAQQKIPTYLIAGLFRPNQLFFKWYGTWYLNLLNHFDQLFVQDLASKNLLVHHGIRKVSIAGDPRIDRVYTILETVQAFPKLSQFKNQQALLLAGSTHAKDIALLLPFIRQNTFWKIVLVPHEVDAVSIQQLKKQLPTALLYTSCHESATLQQAKVLIVDTVGMLNQLYQYADVAYIGGGFDTGIHNTLEPAVFSVPILFGPKYTKFEEARAMVALKSAQVVRTSKHIADVLCLFEKQACRKQLGTTNKQYIEKHRGGSKAIFEALQTFVEN